MAFAFGIAVGMLATVIVRFGMQTSLPSQQCGPEQSVSRQPWAPSPNAVTEPETLPSQSQPRRVDTTRTPRISYPRNSSNDISHSNSEPSNCSAKYNSVGYRNPSSPWGSVAGDSPNRVSTHHYEPSHPEHAAIDPGNRNCIYDSVGYRNPVSPSGPTASR